MNFHVALFILCVANVGCGDDDRRTNDASLTDVDMVDVSTADSGLPDSSAVDAGEDLNGFTREIVTPAEGANTLSLDIADDGTVRIAHGGEQARVFTRRGLGDWAAEDVVEGGIFVSLVSEPGGILHLATASSGQDLRYSRYDGTWTTVDVAEGGNGCRIDVHASGALAIAHGFRRERTVHLARFEGGMWTNEMVNFGSSDGTVVKFGADGTPHVVYAVDLSEDASNRAVGYYRPGGDVEGVDEFGEFAGDLAISADGVLHAIYSYRPPEDPRGEREELRVATSLSGRMGTWNIDTVVHLEGSSVIDSSIGISDSGVVHIAYSSIGGTHGTRYGVLTPAGWELQNVGTESRGVKIELVGETPHLAFRSFEAGLVYMVGR